MSIVLSLTVFALTGLRQHLPALPLCLPVTQLLEGVPRSVLAEDGFKNDDFPYIGCSFLYILGVPP